MVSPKGAMALVRRSCAGYYSVFYRGQVWEITQVKYPGEAPAWIAHQGRDSSDPIPTMSRAIESVFAAVDNDLARVVLDTEKRAKMAATIGEMFGWMTPQAAELAVEGIVGHAMWRGAVFVTKLKQTLRWCHESTVDEIVERLTADGLLLV